MPRIALIDPALTVTNPPRLTAHAGMDALTQCLESLVSKRRQPMAALLAEEGAALALDALPRAAVEPHDRTAREAMALAALYSGMALANSGLGLAHGVAAALGARYPIAHGLACAVMLPAALAWNLPVAAGPLARLARRVQISDADDDGTASESLVSAVRAMAERLGIPSRLAELGVKREDLAQLAVASKGNSLDANPRAIGTPELTALLESLW
jgi:alcohol dehydrogenase class IV